MTLQIVQNSFTASAAEPLVELFEIDASAAEIGAAVLRFSNQLDTAGPIVWKGLTYPAFPIEMSAVELEGRGVSNRPRLSLGNINGFFSALNVTYQDLLGAKVTRRRVLAKYLDGHGSANTSAGLPEDVYFIDQKVSESSSHVVYDLAGVYELEGIKLPLLRVNAYSCVVRYRGPECSYTGTSIMTTSTGIPLTVLRDRGLYAPAAADYLIGDAVYVLVGTLRLYYVCKVNNTVGTLPSPNYWEKDICSKGLTSGCSARFNPGGTTNNAMPFLAFPGTHRLPP